MRREDRSGTEQAGANVAEDSLETAAEPPAANSDALDPDHPSKPQSPRDLTRPIWRYVVRRTLRESGTDQIPDLAAALTFWAVLALAPATLALVSLLGVLGDGDEIVDEVMVTVEDAAPGLDLETVRPVVENLAGQQQAGLALGAGLLIALWSASGYVNAFARAMNRIYQVDEGRPPWKLRPAMLGVTVVVLTLVAAICVAMVLSGRVAVAVGALAGLSEVAVGIWNVAKWPVIVFLVVLVIAILYYATPNVRQPRFRWISIGAFVAVCVWALGTFGFGIYVANFSSYADTYGTLAGVIIFLLWLWLTNNALLFGAELDAEMERARQLQAGIEAEEAIKLPPRDTAASQRRQARVAADLARGRALRASRGAEPDDDPDD